MRSFCQNMYPRKKKIEIDHHLAQPAKSKMSFFHRLFTAKYQNEIKSKQIMKSKGLVDT